MTMEGRYTGLLVLFFSTALFLPPLRSLFAVGGRYEVREITRHVFVWIPEDIRAQDGDPEFGRAGTAGFIIAPEGVVVVDTTNNPIHACELLSEIRRRTDARVKYVIDRDPEFDHTLGNEVFWDQEASIISTPAVLSELRRYRKELPARVEGDGKLQARMRGIHPTLPSETFESELTLHLAGNEMKLLSFADRDLPANSAVYLPQAKVLFLGDLFENGFFPRVGARNCGQSRDRLQRSEERTAALHSRTPLVCRPLFGKIHPSWQTLPTYAARQSDVLAH